MRRWMWLVLVLGLLPSALAQGQGSLEDYQRSDNLEQATRDKVTAVDVRPNWMDADRFWYKVGLTNGMSRYVKVDPLKASKSDLFDHTRMAKAVADISKQPAEPNRLFIEDLRWDVWAEPIKVRVKGKWYAWDEQAGTLNETSVPTPKEETPPQRGRRNRSDDRWTSWSPRQDRSPDGKWLIVERQGKLFLKSTSGNEEKPLSTDGAPGFGYDRSVFWSPDSKKLIAMKTKQGLNRKVNIVESTPRDQAQPKLLTLNYPKPGDDIDISKPHLFDVDNAREITVKDDLFNNPWSINDIRWDKDSSRFTFTYNQRGHRVFRVLAVDATTGDVTALVREEPQTYVDYANKIYYRYIEDSNEIVWMSERSGYNHLYLIDATNGAIKNSITKGDWVVRQVDKFDLVNRQIYFQAGGYDAGQDPYYVHYFRVNFDGTGLVRLTEGDGTHELTYSPSREFYVDKYSRVNMPPIFELRRAQDGKKVLDLEKADATALLATGWKLPQPFVAKGRDGKTDIYGVIYRPTNFDPKKKYPVIENIYAGPQGAFVPKSWSRMNGMQRLAELGFIVVQIDGMGTNCRSKAFLDVSWRNLGDGGFPDRILWMKAAAKVEPAMDITRVGIYGGSAGGQNAMRALLDFNDFYKVAVADCGCHDNRMDKIWWNELYMSWPIDKALYDKASNSVNAHKLKGKLMLTVGEVDSNVDPASTMQVVAALIKADKDFDLLIVPGSNHGAGESAYADRRRRDYFVKNLLGVEPRWVKN